MAYPKNIENPGMYMAWGVLKDRDGWDLRGPYDSKEAASQVFELCGDPYEVVYGSWRAGTDEFIRKPSDN